MDVWDVGPPTAGPFCPPHLLVILLRSLYHLPELNRIGESVQARSFMGNNCHQNQCITKLQHTLAHLSVVSGMLLTFSVKFWSLSLQLSPSSLRPVSQPLIWHYIYMSRLMGQRTGGTVQSLKDKRQINTPGKTLIPVIKLVSLFYKAHGALMILKEYELDDNGGRQWNSFCFERWC